MQKITHNDPALRYSEQDLQRLFYPILVYHCVFDSFADNPLTFLHRPRVQLQWLEQHFLQSENQECENQEFEHENQDDLCSWSEFISKHVHVAPTGELAKLWPEPRNQSILHDALQAVQSPGEEPRVPLHILLKSRWTYVEHMKTYLAHYHRHFGSKHDQVHKNVFTTVMTKAWHWSWWTCRHELAQLQELIWSSYDRVPTSTFVHTISILAVFETTLKNVVQNDENANDENDLPLSCLPNMLRLLCWGKTPSADFVHHIEFQLYQLELTRLTRVTWLSLTLDSAFEFEFKNESPECVGPQVRLSLRRAVAVAFVHQILSSATT